MNDNYLADVIQRGDEGSQLLARLTEPTRRNNTHTRTISSGMNSIAVLDIPEQYDVVVHSATGDPALTDPAAYTASMVERLVEKALALKARPLAFANVIDTPQGDLSLLEIIGTTLQKEADQHQLSILNGENAILGERIRQANVSGTMISLLPRIQHSHPAKLFYEGTTYAVFPHEGKPVYINSDGVGSKTAFYEMLAALGIEPSIELALADSLAMKLDDAVKLAATPKVVADTLEYDGDITPHELRLQNAIIRHQQQLGITYIFDMENIGRRLQGLTPFTYNLGGSVVSTIDEERLHNPPRPQAGDTLIAIRGQPNPRSNGITAKRRAMAENYGKQWWTTPEGKTFLQFLATPSTIFYPVFAQLLTEGTATSVYHLSGGAYEGKLARPLARQGLHGILSRPYKPDEREIRLAHLSGKTTRDVYAQWPMGNEGFITTNDPAKALATLQAHGLEGKIAGRVFNDGVHGLTLKAYDGTVITY